MDKREERLQKRKQQVFRQRMIVTVIAVAVIVLICVVAFSKKDNGTEGNQNNTENVVIDQDAAETNESESTIVENTTAENTTAENTTAENTTELVFKEGEFEDGSGKAGTLPLNDLRYEESLVPGWHTNDKGIWYSLGETFCYYNGWQDIDGNRYHFDSLGYATRGWSIVGGQSCYFDNNGVYVPDADNSKLIAFTFDDGPSQGMDQILELCEQYDARVTFFMIGAQVEKGGAVIPHIVKDRCEVGSHSNTHADMVKGTPEEAKANFDACEAQIAAFNEGVGSTVIRYPYGDYDSAILQTVGRPAIMWDVDSLDWESQDANEIIGIIREEVSEGSIILMHDRYDATVEACRILFPELISQGYQLVTVSELAAAKGIQLEPGVAYYNFRNDAIERGSYCDR